MLIKAASLCQMGVGRKNNEDAVYCDEKGFFMVADGVGGAMAGEVASSLAIATVHQAFLEGGLDGNPLPLLRQAFYQANIEIYHRSCNNSQQQGMGTTLTAGIVLDNIFYIVHVGDSRAYLISEGEVVLLTQDHTVAEELVQKKEITEEESRLHPQKHILTRALGAGPQVDVDAVSGLLLHQDKLLLCSDGLSNMLSDEEILALTNDVTEPEQAVRALYEAAIAAGGVDDISIILAFFSHEEVS